MWFAWCNNIVELPAETLTYKAGHLHRGDVIILVLRRSTPKVMRRTLVNFNVYCVIYMSGEKHLETA